MSIINLISKITNNEAKTIKILELLETNGYRITATFIPHPTDAQNIIDITTRVLTEKQLLDFNPFAGINSKEFFRQRNNTIDVVAMTLEFMKVKL